jgi:Dolichyl-phosphate-mannose-protein mannosyltransferase
MNSVKIKQIKLILFVIIIFLTALATRSFIWQDARFEAEKVQSGVAFIYQYGADCVLKEGLLSHFDSKSCIADLNIQGHPRGYPILLSYLFYFFGKSNAVIQIFSLIINCLSAIFIFLIVRDIFSESIAFLTGMLAALSPSFSLNSIYLLPDTLAIFPILIAVFCLVKAYQKPSIWKVCLVGFFIGLSCWLRANAFLLAPFLAFLFPLLFPKKNWLKYSLAMVVVAFLAISPMTIRNAIVYKSFIPISLGSGQTLLEGIGDYDKENRFGMPKTDVGICEMEAKEFNRPDYFNNLFGEDGIKRDKMRIQKGFQIIKENPFWFAGVMFKRALWMTNIEKAQKVSTELPSIYSSNELDNSAPAVNYDLADIKSKSILANDSVKLELNEQDLSLISDNSKNDKQLEIGDIEVKPYFNSVLRLKIKLRQGRIKLSVTDSTTNYFSTIVQTDEAKASQLEQIIDLPFVSKSNKVKIIVKNEVTSILPTITEIYSLQLFESEETTLFWQKPFRFLIFGLQTFFVLPLLLLFEIIGIIILLKRKNWQSLIILLAVPFYYFCVQSTLHTEFRYVLVIHYFLFSLFSFGVFESGKYILNLKKKPENI